MTDRKRHFALRPSRTHKTFTPRCACGWEGDPQPHHTRYGRGHNQIGAHLDENPD